MRMVREEVRRPRSPAGPAPAADGMERSAALLSRIAARTARVGVIGLGYVGLPLARTFAINGYPVLGFDIDPGKVTRLREGRSYIGHIGDEVVADLRARGFDATHHFERL